jgi:hypothetical protein
MSMIEQIFLSSAKVIACENELKPGVIKVETQFWYYLGPPQPNKYSELFKTRIKTGLETSQFHVL